MFAVLVPVTEYVHVQDEASGYQKGGNDDREKRPGKLRTMVDDVVFIVLAGRVDTHKTRYSIRNTCKYKTNCSWFRRR